MDRAEAIRYLESMAIDLTGACVEARSEKVSDYIARKIQAVDMALAALREQESLAQATSEWVSVEERLPDAAQGMEGVLGFVNGYNGRITFTDAYLFVKYDYAEKVWWSEDYDIEGCKVTHWLPLPEPPPGSLVCLMNRMRYGGTHADDPSPRQVRNYGKFCGKPLTHAERIRSMSDEELADFLIEIAYGRETPWSEQFRLKFCKRCPEPEYTLDDGRKLRLHECDFKDGKCPHGGEIAWWLKQVAMDDD